QELKMKFLKMRNSKYQEIRDVVGHVVTIIKTTEQCTFRDETFLNEIGFEVARIYQHVDTVGTIESEINRLIASKNLAFFAENLLSNTLKRIEKNNVLETL
ncbi:hypothetical protein U8V72_25450, partial [Priestia filamentosa]|uniref:hypothetical protein n=1 Tax=Priestia filamentosa TaxID=1402861 RepID=UPI00397A8473